MARQRILIFSTAYYPFVGGAEVAIKEITGRLGDDIFDMITARLDGQLPKFERVGNVNVYRLGFGYPSVDKLLLPFVGAIKAWSLNRKNPYDIFWCMMVTFASGAAYVANWFQKKVPIVLTLQEGDSEKHLRYRWFGLIDLSWRLALVRTTTLTTISKYLLDRAHKLGFNGKSFLVPNGVDIRKFEGEKILHDGIILTTTSRLVEKNGIVDVVDAIGYLPENVKFKIIGTGPLDAKLKQEVKKRNLESRVEFMGFIEQKEIPKHLHESDIFIRPSLSEGMGNSFIEAMAARLPVIATPVGGIPDFIFDPDRNPEKPPTGLFVNVHDPRGIARQVERLIKDKNLRDTLIANANRLVREKYDWNLIAEEMRSKVFSI